MVIKPIKTESDHRAALTEIEKLLDSQPGSADFDRMEVLVTLVESYEASHFPIPAPDDPAEVLEYYKESRGKGLSMDTSMGKDIHSDVENAIEAYEKAIGNVAIRTREMIIKLGEVKTLTTLVCSPDLQRGFQELRNSHQLDKSFEAIVLRHKELFNQDTINAAEWRLKNVDDLL